MFIVTPETVWNPGALETRYLPRQFFERVTLFGRRGLTPGLAARMVFEIGFLRYLGALMPFVFAMLVWTEHAVAIAQAPLLMFPVVYFVETSVLRMTPEARARLIAPAEAERGLDLLRVRAVAILTRIAAGRGMATGRLHLVVEQSDIARVAPLTYVSVQSEDGPEVLALTPEETALIRDTLFQPPLDERTLHRINLAQGDYLRDIVLEARSVSAHARLAAMMNA